MMRGQALGQHHAVERRVADQPVEVGFRVIGQFERQVAAGQWHNRVVGSGRSRLSPVAATAVFREVDTRLERVREARMKGYEGDSCGECGNFTLVRNGTCLKCATCGSTSGCS